MALQCGIVGLSKVGKTTLFNCLSSKRAEAGIGTAAQKAKSGEKEAQEALDVLNKYKVEGKKYVVKDGDILHIRFNV